jgi:hypothetical protein
MRGVTTGRLADPLPSKGSWDEPAARILLDQCPALLWTTDMDLRLTSCLGTVLADLGFWSNQLVGVRVEELFEDPAEELPAILAHHRALRGERVTFDMLLAGRGFHAHAGPLADSTGSPIGSICVALAASLDRVRPTLALAT